MADRVFLTIGTTKSVFVADAAKPRRSFAPDPHPEFGQCVHKIARHDAAPDRLYMQNHGGWAKWTGPGGPRPDVGVLRSDDHPKGRG
jgi:hypothetical protein